MANPCLCSGSPSSSAELGLLLLSRHSLGGCWGFGVSFSTRDIRAEGGVVRQKGLAEILRSGDQIHLGFFLQKKIKF